MPIAQPVAVEIPEIRFRLGFIRRYLMLRARLPVLAATLLLMIATALPCCGQTLRIAMTASDTPTTTGIPNNGGEGCRFLGFPAFDGLVDWDFTHPERIAGITPGLASE
jgi:peptide/nickel transport system substrate-binding protein